MKYKSTEGKEVLKYWYEICRLRDSLVSEFEIEIRESDSKIMKNHIKFVRKSLYKTMLRIENINFETLLISDYFDHSNIFFITTKKELMLWVVKYSYENYTNALHEVLNFLENKSILNHAKIYKYDRMKNELDEILEGSSLPFYLQDFYQIIESDEMKQLIRRKKLEKIKKLKWVAKH